MMRSLVTRTLFEKRWFLAGWAAVYGTMSTLVMMFYPSFSEAGSFDQVAKSLPSQLQGFIGDPRAFRTIDGFISTQIYDIRLSLLIIIMTTMLAVSLTVKEEESGDLRTLLSIRRSRLRIMTEKYIAACIIIFVLNCVTVIGIYIGVISLAETTSAQLLSKLFALSVLFSMTAFTIPFSLGLATGKRSVTLFVGLFVALGSYILTTFARTVDWLAGWDRLSLIYYFDTEGLRTNDFELWNIWILLGIIVILLTLASVLFRRRDIT